MKVLLSADELKNRMKSTQPNIISTLVAVILFLSFSIVHEYEWLIPPSPVQTVASTSAVPLSDVIEEQAIEDELEHHSGYLIFLPITEKTFKNNIIAGILFVPKVTTPPPDIV